jgi:hypothetical protein
MAITGPNPTVIAGWNLTPFQMVALIGLVVGVIGIGAWVNERERTSEILKLIRENQKRPSTFTPSSATHGGKVGTILRSQIPAADRSAFDKHILQALPPKHINLDNLPRVYDFATAFKGASSSVLDQGNCGSCWSFAVAGCASDRVRRYTPLLLDHLTELNGEKVTEQMSPYLLASCDNCSLLNDNPDFVRNAKIVIDAEKCSDECDGGVIQFAMIYLQQNGLITVGCNQGFRGRYTCHNLDNLYQIQQALDSEHKGERCLFWQFREPVKVNLYEEADLTTDVKRLDNEQAIMAEIHEYGPVCSGYMVYQSFYDFFAKNPTGIYKERPSTSDKEVGGHAIIITGWGEENGVKYWIVRNSWGRKWGDNGYFKILRGKNFCLCESDVFAVQMHFPWLDYVIKCMKTGQEPSHLIINVPGNVTDVAQFFANAERQQEKKRNLRRFYWIVVLGMLALFAGWFMKRSFFIGFIPPWAQ